MREPSFEELFRVADLFGVEPGHLLSPNTLIPLGHSLQVRGRVEAGAWAVAYEYAQDDMLTFTGRADIDVDPKHRFGLMVRGDSMDEMYPEGTILECVSVFAGIEPAPGKRVIMVRKNLDGDVEATVKELVERDGDLWAVPRSSNPAHFPFKVGEPQPGITEVQIIAVVVASIRQE